MRKPHYLWCLFFTGAASVVIIIIIILSNIVFFTGAASVVADENISQALRYQRQGNNREAVTQYEAVSLSYYAL